MLPVRVTAYATSDLAGLVRVYETDNPGAGDRLYAAFLRRVGQSSSFPLVGPHYYRDMRKLLLRPFKILVIYRAFPEFIQVVALVDGRRKPAAIKRQLRKRS